MVNETVEIGGKLRPVNFGRNAMIEFERITGCKLLGGDKSVFDSHESWRAFAFAALKWGLYNPTTYKEPTPPFNLIQVGDWLDARPESMTEIFNAYVGALPEAEKNETASEMEEANQNSLN